MCNGFIRVQLYDSNNYSYVNISNIDAVVPIYTSSTIKLKGGSTIHAEKSAQEIMQQINEQCSKGEQQ